MNTSQHLREFLYRGDFVAPHKNAGWQPALRECGAEKREGLLDALVRGD